MTPDQFCLALRRLELQQLEAAALFGANDRTIRRWAMGERSVPAAIAILLQLMLAHKINAADIERAKRLFARPA